jgi:hypothetical protein
MNLYLNGKKQKLYLNGVLCRINLAPAKTITNIVRLLSSDGYILKDSNGLYLTPKESE